MKELKNMSADERSLLLYLESCSVDYGGRTNQLRMNDEDREIASRWHEEGFIQQGRIVARDHNKDGTTWVKLSEEAWKLAHEERRERNKRMWERRRYLTTEKSREINGDPHFSGMNGGEVQPSNVLTR